mgnify:CR=1 FL=1
MKKIIIVIIITLIAIIAILTSLVTYTNGSNEKYNLEDKVTQELMYLNQYFVAMLGDFNSLSIGDNRLQETEPKIQTNINTNLSDQVDKKQDSQTNDNLQQNSKVEDKTDTVQNGILKNNGKYDAKWEKIKTEIEQIYQVWNTVSIDLYSLNIDSNSILAFNDGLNKATQAVKKQDKTNAINEITGIYGKILDYRKAYDKNTRETDLLTIQYNSVSAYADVTNGKWSDANLKLANAEKLFSNLLNTLTNDYTNQATMSQCYISINELKKAVNLQDKEIFFIEYRNLMSKMEIIVT